MEIRKIGQGGQGGFDNASGTSDLGRGQAVYGENVDIQVKAVEKTGTENRNEAVNEEELQKALEKLKGFIGDDNTKVEYQFHSKFNDLMIKIVDKTTKEVILEVPPQKILDLVAKMIEMVGVLFDKKA